MSTHSDCSYLVRQRCNCYCPALHLLQLTFCHSNWSSFGTWQSRNKTRVTEYQNLSLQLQVPGVCVSHKPWTSKLACLCLPSRFSLRTYWPCSCGNIHFYPLGHKIHVILSPSPLSPHGAFFTHPSLHRGILQPALSRKRR